MDGPWQIGHKTAAEYGRIARETAKAMRLVDPAIELVACGSSNHAMPTFGTWEATVLAETYDVVDYVSMHAYYQEYDGDRDSFLGCAVDADRFIEDVVATADHARASAGTPSGCTSPSTSGTSGTRAGSPARRTCELEQAPRLIEDIYSLTDAVVVGTLLNSLLRHADRVKIACLAQLVNVIAPIMTEPGGPAWRQTTYHPFALTARLRPGGPCCGSATARPDARDRSLGRGAAAGRRGGARRGGGPLTVFAVNRDQHEPMTVELDLRGLPGLDAGEHTTLAGDDPDAVNDAEHRTASSPASSTR